MLQAMRDRITGWLAYLLIGIIALPLALWGVHNYVAGGGETFVAKVNGTEISRRALDREYADYRQRVASMFGGQIPPGFLDRVANREQVLEGMIDREVLSQYAMRHGMEVPDQLLASAIQSIEAFRIDGAFSQEQYRAQLRAQGQSPASFEAQLRRDLAVQQLNDGLGRSALVTNAALQTRARIEQQTRRIGVYRLARSAYLDLVSVPQEAVVAEYEENPQRYRTPEQVKIRYLSMSEDTLAAEVDPDPEVLRQRYQTRVDQGFYQTEEQRRASHILIAPEGDSEEAKANARAEAQALKEELAAGADFDALAKEFSDDPGSASDGGDLGKVSRGMMTPPFEEALFAIDGEGEVVGPVATDFGFHLIRLDEVIEGSVKPFDDPEVRAELEEDYRLREVEAIFYDRVEQLADLAFQFPETLEEAAQSLDLEIKESDWFSANEGTGIASEAKVREAAFAEEVLELGTNSELLELSGRRVAVIRLADRRPPEVKPLDAVADEIRARLRREEATRLVEDRAETLVQAVLEGTSLPELEAPGGSYMAPMSYARTAQELDPAILDAAFGLGRPESGQALVERVTLPNGDQAIITVFDVADGVFAELEDSTVEQLRQQAERARRTAVLDGFTQMAREAAKVTVNEFEGDEA